MRPFVPFEPRWPEDRERLIGDRRFEVAACEKEMLDSGEKTHSRLRYVGRYILAHTERTYFAKKPSCFSPGLSARLWGFW